MREVVQPSSGVAIRGPIVAHESVDHNVELGLTLIAFGWRAHERVDKTMLRHQQQDDFLLSTTLRRLDYRKIPSRFLEPKRRTIEGRITSAFSGRQAVPAADRQQSCSPKTKRGGSRRYCQPEFLEWFLTRLDGAGAPDTPWCCGLGPHDAPAPVAVAKHC
jgi:hypothetical protein